MIEELRRLVERACAADSNHFGYGIWSHHITAVADNARRLAPRFGADPEIVEIAALLHDYASVKDVALYRDHHLHGPVEAEKLLRGFGYPQQRIDAVKHCIAAHRGSVEVEPVSAEAACLRSADAMAHVQNVPSLLYLAYRHHGLDIDQGARWVRAKLERSWHKLDDEVRELVRAEYRAALAVLS